MFTLLSLTTGSPVLTRLAESILASEPRRRINDDFGIKHSVAECFDDPIPHTWEPEVWSQHYNEDPDAWGNFPGYAGNLKFVPPQGGIARDIVLVVKRVSADGTIAGLMDTCSDCDKVEQSETDSKALILTLKTYLNYHQTFRMHMNFDFNEDAKEMDFNEDIAVYYCHKPLAIYWEPETDLEGTVSNLVGFMAQGSWETARWLACDENNHSGLDDAACTQRPEKTKYHLDSPVSSGVPGLHRCPVTKEMTITGVASQEGKPALACKPFEAGDAVNVEKCCWWGRGSIQLTGPANIGQLQYRVLDRTEAYKHMDLCTHPDLVCTNDDLKFISGLYYWVNTVQEDKCWEVSRKTFVDSNYDQALKAGDCRGWARGISGSVNMGDWQDVSHDEDCEAATAHDPSIDCVNAPDSRIDRFANMMGPAKTALNGYSGVDSNAPNCSGNKAVDTIFYNMNMPEVSGITPSAESGRQSNYKWESFCTALRSFIHE